MGCFASVRRIQKDERHAVIDHSQVPTLSALPPTPAPATYPDVFDASSTAEASFWVAYSPRVLSRMTTDSRLEPLEQLFRKLEEESEQRARFLADEDVASVLNSSHSSAAMKVKERRRGSISISRIGQLVKDEGPVAQAPSLTPISSLYRHQLANESNTSIASGASEFSNDHAAHDEDENAVTQMEHIAGKPSLSSKLLPRRLMRSYSTSVIPSGSAIHSIGGDSAVAMRIGVSVQEAVTVLETTPEEPIVHSHRASVVAQANTLRHKSSSSSLAGLRAMATPATNSNWLTKAKNITMKPFRRHSSVSKPSKLR